jgi:hypothetical protein
MSSSTILRSLAGLFLAVTIAAAAAPARAQLSDASFIQSAPMRVAIPFAFSVGDTYLPAGTYIIMPVSQTSGALLIRSLDGKSKAAVQAGGTLGRGRDSTPGKLVFHRYDDAYYLTEVWRASSLTGREVTMAKAEQMLAQRGARPDVVAVIMKGH